MVCVCVYNIFKMFAFVPLWLYISILLLLAGPPWLATYSFLVLTSLCTFSPPTSGEVQWSYCSLQVDLYSDAVAAD